MSAPITIAVTFDSATRKRDKSVRLAFTSNLEVSTADFMTMDLLVQSEGHLLFSRNELQEADIPEEPAQSREGKSKGQRLRAVMFLVWRKRGVEEPFEVWYERSFEKLLDKFKEELD